MAVRITRSGVGLTVGIIVLALVVLGGLYLVKQRGEQARREEVIQIAQENLEEQSETGTLTPSVDGNNETSGTVTEEETTTETTTDNGTTTEESTTTTEEETVVATELPATGMNETYAIIVVGLLAFAGASYLSSRRTLLETR